MEERGSDGWCDGGDRWWTRLTEWGRKIIPKTGWCISERAICDFERGRRVMAMRDDERVRSASMEAEQRSGYGDMQVEQHISFVLHVWERILYSIRSLTFNRWRDLRVGVIWENLGVLQLHERESFGCVEVWIAVSWGDYNIVSCSSRVWSERWRWRWCWLFWYQGMGGYNGADECGSCRIQPWIYSR